MKELTILCYSKCSTCKKALAWLDAHEIPYTTRPIKEEHPSEEELKTWYQAWLNGTNTQTIPEKPEWLT